MEQETDISTETSSRFTSWYAKSSKPIAITVGIVLTVLLVFSIGYVSNIDKLIVFYDEAGFFHALRTLPYLPPPFLCLATLPIIPFIYVTRHAPERRQIPILVVAFLISCFIVGSQSLVLCHTFSALFANPLNSICTIGSLVSFTFFIFFLLRPAFYLISTKRSVGDHSLSKPTNVFLIFGLLVLAWLPYVVVYAPGSLNYDLCDQLAQFTGILPLSNHHPVLSTSIYGSIFSFGRILGGDAVGLMCIIIFQTIMLAGTLAFEVVVIERLRAPRWLVFAAIVFFMLYPLFPCFAAQGVKDTLFAAIFIVYVSLFVLYTQDARQFAHSKGWMAALLIAALLCGLLRNNGIFIVLFSLPFLVFFHAGARDRIRALIPFAICLALIPIISTGLIAALGAQQGSIKEALSVPLMQSTRTVLNHPEDVSEEEWEILNDTFVLEKLENRYDPNTSDMVKDYYNDESSLSEYLGVWAAQGFRHPLTYLDAFGELTYGYWSLQIAPDYDIEALYNRQKSNGVIGSEDYFDLNFWGSYSLRQDFSQIIDFLMHIPFVGFLVQGGIYTWTILILGALLIFAKRPKYLIVLLPCVILMLTIIFGPKNGLTRYSFGETCVYPLLIWSVIVFVQSKLVLKSS